MKRTTFGENMPKNDGRLSTSIDVKYRTKSKFSAKVLVWVAISENGRSNAYLAPKNCAIDSKIYSKEKRLIPFLKKYHAEGRYVFWPDLATAHYAKNMIAVFNKFGIKFVECAHNPPNVPQLRPIQKFWSLFKSNVCKNDRKSKSIDHLKTRIRQKK